MKQEEFSKNLKKKAKTDLLVWKSMEVKYKSEISKIDANANLTDDSFSVVLMLTGLFNYSIYNESDEQMKDFVTKIETHLNSNEEPSVIFKKLAELETPKKDLDLLGKIIQIIVPAFMLIGIIITFFNWSLGGKIILAGVGLWGLLNGSGMFLEIIKSKQNNTKSLKEFSFYFSVFLAIFFLGLGLFMFYLIF
ncbi:MAG TPA: hypothetical protein ENK52_00600 [Saprospiraceae bacterium]|nr:hypothetical protein [Saprospiraceae bacterium]